MEGTELDLKGPLKGDVAVNVVGARGLKNADSFGKSDPFAVISIPAVGKRTLTTPVLDDTLDPDWKFSGRIPLAGADREIAKTKLLNIVINDKDNFSVELLGKVDIDISKLYQEPGSWISSYYDLMEEDGKKKAQGKVFVQTCYIPEGFKTPDAPQAKL